jgi:acyl-CoA synthetase (AMP-forming)/AMP-acid ligase II
MQIPDVGFTPTIPQFLRRLAAQWEERELLVGPDEPMSYAEAERTSRRVAKDLLSRGFGKGSRIGFVFGNTADWLVSWLAVARIGAVAMPFPTTYRPAELRKALLIGDTEALIIPAELFGHDQLAFVEEAVEGLADREGPDLLLSSAPCLRRVLVTSEVDRGWADVIDLSRGRGGDHPDIDEEFFSALEDQVHPSDPMIVIFTSGTTAEPKGVVHCHGTYVRHAYNVADANDVRGDHRIFGGMPFFWIGGVSHTMGPVMVRGNTFICAPKFDADLSIELIEREQATEAYMFPNMLHRLREHAKAVGRDLSTMPALSPPPSDVPADRRASSLGMTETCAAYIASGPREHVIPEEFRGAHGFPVPMSEYRIVDLETGETLPDGVEGEICVRGYSLMLGMCKRERHEVFDDDGWYHTGDKGYLSGPYIFFTGRAKDLIKTAGANVAPREVEVLLDSYPEVLMSVVVGLDDPERGEIVGAAVVPASGATVDPVELVTRANHDLSSYKVPRRVLVVAETDVPYLATGKPDRLALAESLSAEGESVSPRRDGD